MATKQTAKKCNRCGGTIYPETWIYSRATGNRYCSDLNACRKRANRKKVA